MPTLKRFFHHKQKSMALLHAVAFGEECVFGWKLKVSEIKRGFAVCGMKIAFKLLDNAGTMMYAASIRTDKPKFYSPFL